MEEMVVTETLLSTNDKQPTMRFLRVINEAKQPVYASSGAIGMDLCAAESCLVPTKGRKLISTGLQVQIPEGHYGRVAPRSGLAVKNGIDVGAGVVDPDYRGEVKVLLFNFDESDFEVKPGDRIAQMVLERCTKAVLVEVKKLDETVRGSGGFGSTGKDSLSEQICHLEEICRGQNLVAQSKSLAINIVNKRLQELDNRQLRDAWTETDFTTPLKKFARQRKSSPGRAVLQHKTQSPFGFPSPFDLQAEENSTNNCDGEDGNEQRFRKKVTLNGREFEFLAEPNLFLPTLGGSLLVDPLWVELMVSALMSAPPPLLQPGPISLVSNYQRQNLTDEERQTQMVKKFSEETGMKLKWSMGDSEIYMPGKKNFFCNFL